MQIEMEIGSCGPHVVNGAFKTAQQKTEWENREKCESCLWNF